MEGFDKDFRSIHYEIVDLFDEDSDDLEKEHEVLDKHEDDVTATSLRLQKIIANSSSAMDAGNKKALSRKLARVERHLRGTEEALAPVKEDHDDVALLEQYQEQMSDAKKELSTLYEELVAADLPAKLVYRFPTKVASFRNTN